MNLLWRTHFDCDHAEFSSTTNGGGGNGRAGETWQVAKVSVCNITENHRWLVVTIPAESTPVIWRAIKDDWLVMCDEAALTMSMRTANIDLRTTTVHKIRFASRKEYWSFVANVTYARVRAYDGGWPNIEQLNLAGQGSRA
ncbi:hypothetical protein ONZ51_g5832 [Trametes cubensis]|uniref:Uncharacterized protein n=1 Tax=Trametes cubensis TaxID=1111947 RepID=A0AAD7TVN1_9APHY|nr:hypothetical protein ONZ51_g5832 [Trametes cubensis]